jgi:hypothetical protein
MELEQSFKVRLFIDPASDMLLGTCWKAEDIDGNQATVWLARSEKGKSVWRWEFKYWNGERVNGEVNNLANLTRSLSLLLQRDQKGEYPVWSRAANFYTGRLNKE